MEEKTVLMQWICKWMEAFSLCKVETILKIFQEISGNFQRTSNNLLAQSEQEKY